MPLTLLPGARVVVATHNPGKAVEVAALLQGRVETISAVELDLPEPEETEATFTGNALLKARVAAAASGLIAVADDSGLAVDALGGAPGVLSARWAGEPRDFGAAMAQVEREFAESGSNDDRARFHCALAVAWPDDGPAVVVEGQAAGRLVFPGRGDRGFGYDPIFRPQDGALTYGEMDPAEKHATSHRAAAFAKLKAALF